MHKGNQRKTAACQEFLLAHHPGPLRAVAGQGRERKKNAGEEKGVL
jgi:hypothetical protein